MTEAGRRIDDPVGQRDQHGRHPVAESTPLLLRPHRHRHHAPPASRRAARPGPRRSERMAPAVTASTTSLAVPPSTSRTRWHVVEGQLGEGHPPVGRDGPVDRGPWGLERRRRQRTLHLAVPIAQAANRLHRPAHRAHHRLGVTGKRGQHIAPLIHVVRQRVGRPPGVTPTALRRPSVHRHPADRHPSFAGPGRRPIGRNRGRGDGSGGQVEERRHHLRPRHPVDDGVVHLGHQGEVSSLQPLDHMELPQWPAPVERSRGQVGDQGRQLGPPARRRKADPAHVVVDVEVGIVDHRRVLEPEGHLDHPLAERRHQGQPVGHQVADAPEAHSPVHRGGVEDQRTQDVQVGGGRLEGQEGPVQAGQTLHPATGPSIRSRRGPARSRPAPPPRRRWPSPPAG